MFSIKGNTYILLLAFASCTSFRSGGINIKSASEIEKTFKGKFIYLQPDTEKDADLATSLNSSAPTSGVPYWHLRMEIKALYHDKARLTDDISKADFIIEYKIDHILHQNLFNSINTAVSLITLCILPAYSGKIDYRISFDVKGRGKYHGFFRHYEYPENSFRMVCSAFLLPYIYWKEYHLSTIGRYTKEVAQAFVADFQNALVEENLVEL